MSNLKREKVPIPPSGKLAWSLKYSSHNSETAIAELVDNAFEDAVGATKLMIFKKDNEIIVSDNGAGMSYETLSDAIRPGSSKTQLSDERLGIFGVGLNLGASHLGNRLTILTHTGGQKFFTGIYDIDTMSREGFVAELGEMTDAEKSNYGYYMNMINGKTGTVIIIDKLDEDYKYNNSRFATSLSRYLGETFRYKLDSKRNITIVADSKAINVKPLYPLTMQVKPQETGKAPAPPQAKIDTPIVRTFIDPKTNKKFTVKIQFSYLPLLPIGTDVDLEFPIAEKNQGIYYLRNNRQIARAKQWIDIGKHNQLNRLRCEIHFDGAGDSAFGTNSEKNRILHPAWFKTQLAETMNSIVTTYRNAARADALVNKENDPEFIKQLKRVSLAISKEFERKKGIRGPKSGLGDKRRGGTVQTGLSSGRQIKRTSHSPGAASQSATTGHLNIEFVPAENLGHRIYEVDTSVQSALIIRLNRKNSFYNLIHAEQGLMPHFLKLIAAEAWAEREIGIEFDNGFFKNERPSDVFDMFKERVSTKIDTLLSDKD